MSNTRYKHHRRLLLLAVVVVGLWVGFSALSGRDQQKVPPIAAEHSGKLAEADLLSAVPDTRDEVGADHPPDCDVPQQQSKPTMDQMRIFEAASYLPAQLQSYSLLDRVTVTDLAHQGDTIAMLALAELEVYAARGFGEEANWTARQSMGSDRPTHKLSTEDQRNKWRSALRWYYRAALEGRVMALVRYGRTLSESSVSPVELGWIEEAGYYRLTESERRSLEPDSIYQEVAKRLAPESYDWAMRSIDSIVPAPEFTEAHELVIASTVEQFFHDLDAGAYPTPEAIVATFPSYSSELRPGCTAAGD